MDFLTHSLGSNLGYLGRTGTVLGIDESNYFEQRSFYLKSGDILFLYTDGVSDAENDEGNFYALDNVRELVLSQRDLPCMEILKSIEQNIRFFISNKPILDDITMVIIKKI
jgi:sigma-B regulation protein RsbU (phosphoserine phosphatase)